MKIRRPRGDIEVTEHDAGLVNAPDYLGESDQLPIPDRSGIAADGRREVNTDQMKRPIFDLDDRMNGGKERTGEMNNTVSLDWESTVQRHPPPALARYLDAVGVALPDLSQVQPPLCVDFD